MNRKQLLLITVATLFFTNAHTQNNSLSGQQFQVDLVSTKTMYAYAPVADGGKLSAGFNEEKYLRFKKMRTNGIVLTGIGAGLITGGAALIAMGSNDNHNNGYWDGDYYYENISKGDRKIIAGILGIAFGALSTGGGITMWAIGNNKMKKYGSGEITIQPYRNGLGVAYQF
ncbi:MAG: hypothetical protein QM594_04465 [Niabella sp.]